MGPIFIFHASYHATTCVEGIPRQDVGGACHHTSQRVEWQQWEGIGGLWTDVGQGGGSFSAAHDVYVYEITVG